MSEQPDELTEEARELARLRLLDRLTVDESAVYLRVSRRTVYRLVDDGSLSLVKIRSSSFIRRTDLDRIGASRRRRAA